MERRYRYDVLPEEEQDEAAEVATVVMIVPPPDENGTTTLTGKDGDMYEPPSYEIATTLPSYEEAEQEAKKEKSDERSSLNESMHYSIIEDSLQAGDAQVGTDGMFCMAFVGAFLFNWLGLFVTFCVTRTSAGRLGALSGFGLSVVKWASLAKHTNWPEGAAEIDAWIWFLIILLGILLFFRGALQYLRIKYEWSRIGSQLRDRIYMYF